MRFSARMQTAVPFDVVEFSRSFLRSVLLNINATNNDLTKRRSVQPSQLLRGTDRYVYIRCSVKEKRRPKLADSIKMLISSARIVQTFVPRCLFLVFPSFAPRSPSRTMRPSRISLMRLLADRVSRARRRELRETKRRR